MPYWPLTPGDERRWVSPSPTAVADMSAPHSRIRWEMRCPSLETNHFSVSHMRYAACESCAPASVPARVTATSRSPFSAKETDSGSSSQSLSHRPLTTSTGASSKAGPGTRAEARAVSAACSPACRARAVVRSDVAKKPHDEPISARTPTPACSSCASPSMSPFWAVIDSDRTFMTRASA